MYNCKATIAPNTDTSDRTTIANTGNVSTIASIAHSERKRIM